MNNTKSTIEPMNSNKNKLDSKKKMTFLSNTKRNPNITIG